MVEVRKVTRADVKELSRVLARAFDDDPLTAWMMPDPQRRKRLLHRVFSIQLRIIQLPEDESYTTADLAAGALWQPPGKWPVPLARQLRAGPGMVPVLRGRAVTALRGLRLLEKGHPKEPSWYLFTLGTDPSRQGRGLGSAVMQPVLDRCDADRVPAYLESSKFANIPFYERHGFTVTGEITLPDGPPVWPMWRDPR